MPSIYLPNTLVPCDATVCWDATQHVPKPLSMVLTRTPTSDFFPAAEALLLLVVCVWF